MSTLVTRQFKRDFEIVLEWMRRVGLRDGFSAEFVEQDIAAEREIVKRKLKNSNEQRNECNGGCNEVETFHRYMASEIINGLDAPLMDDYLADLRMRDLIERNPR